MNRMTSVSVLMAIALFVFAIGCGGGQEKKDRDFSTSGSREADQRADQRMAQARQLEGGGGEEKKKEGGADTAKKALYERLGGEQGIAQLVDDFVTRALADPRVNFERKGVKRGGMSFSRGKSVEWSPSAENVAKLKKHLAQFISLATGGPATYEGGEMKSVHAGLHITNAEFDASVGDLKASLDKFQVPNQEQRELLAIIESTRPQVVEER